MTLEEKNERISQYISDELYDTANARVLPPVTETEAKYNPYLKVGESRIRLDGDFSRQQVIDLLAIMADGEQ